MHRIRALQESTRISPRGADRHCACERATGFLLPPFSSSPSAHSIYSGVRLGFINFLLATYHRPANVHSMFARGCTTRLIAAARAGSDERPNWVVCHDSSEHEGDASPQQRRHPLSPRFVLFLKYIRLSGQVYNEWQLLLFFFVHAISNSTFLLAAAASYAAPFHHQCYRWISGKENAYTVKANRN